MDSTSMGLSQPIRGPNQVFESETHKADRRERDTRIVSESHGAAGRGAVYPQGVHKKPRRGLPVRLRHEGGRRPSEQQASMGLS